MATRDPQSFLIELSGWADARGSRPQTHRYGPDPEHEADLRVPDRPGPHPVAVLLHGGFWRAALTRSTLAALAVDLTERGWATWNVEYRRAGCGGGVPETLDDVRGAIDALAGVDAPLDRARTVVIGHSAGGQLALATAAPSAVRAVVSLAGVCDLATSARQGIGEQATVAFMGGGPEQRPDAYALGDPLSRLPTGVEVLLVHGDADQRVPVDYSRRYARAAHDAGDRCALLELAGADHFSLIDPRTPEWATIAVRVQQLGGG